MVAYIVFYLFRRAILHAAIFLKHRIKCSQHKDFFCLFDRLDSYLIANQLIYR